MRKLASIQRIESLEPIPGADAIVRAKILGWSVVVKKGEFQPGDSIIYCEIDSLLPERPEFEFLRASSFKPSVDQGEAFQRPAGFRIKTLRLRGQVSQGICFPLSLLPTGSPTEIGTDVTELLGITKYDIPPIVGMSGKVKGGFPGFISKTDETRVQVLEECLVKHRGRKMIVTEKLDGTSFTAYLRNGENGVCSRNLELDITDANSLFSVLFRNLKLEEKLKLISICMRSDVAIQGEVIGPGIQGNKYALPSVELRIFNIISLNSNKLIDHEEQIQLLQSAGLQSVPVLEPLVLNHSVEELVAISEGASVLNPKTPREGIILRPESEIFEEQLGGRLSFKVINPKFLLKYDE